MLLPEFIVDDIIKTALREDIHYVDVTTDYLIPAEQKDVAELVCKADGVICGIEIALRVFSLLDSELNADVYLHDGDVVKKGDVICRLNGYTRALLKGERTALNLLQHLSGIATATATAVAQCRGTDATIADTRKTLPGLRALQKYAVTVGGGKNHRFNLSDAAMLKDNHIDAAGGITAAIRSLRKMVGHMVQIEVETRNLTEVREALEAGANIIMLDNMDCETMKEAVRINNHRAKLEASGGIRPENLRDIALTGVDIISIGAITHSVTALDISMKIKK